MAPKVFYFILHTFRFNFFYLETVYRYTSCTHLPQKGKHKPAVAFHFRLCASEWTCTSCFCPVHALALPTIRTAVDPSWLRFWFPQIRLPRLADWEARRKRPSERASLLVGLKLPLTCLVFRWCPSAPSILTRCCCCWSRI